MNAQAVLTSTNLPTRVLAADAYSGESYLIDSDGDKWHVAIRRLPRHVDVGIIIDCVELA